jgi:mannose-6-phosphate isomerase-like protein (cupin superfamily)
MAEGALKAGYVVNADEVEARPEAGDTVSAQVTIDASKGCDRLTQQILRFSPGRSQPRRPAEGMQEILYGVSGSGAIHLNGEHALEADTGVYVLPEDSYEVENPGPNDLVVVSVLTPIERRPDGLGRDRKVTVRFADQPTIPVGGPREFRYLVNEDMGSVDVTQFLGLVQPSRAPQHMHEYDEVAYIVEGEGEIHMGDVEAPVRAGTCIFFPRGVSHCLENSGTGVMRVMGVFYPSGSPGIHYVTEGEGD